MSTFRQRFSAWLRRAGAAVAQPSGGATDHQDFRERSAIDVVAEGTVNQTRVGR